MLKFIKEKIPIIYIIFLIIISTLLIGTPVNEDNVFPIYIVFGIFSIFYFLVKFIKKEKILINKMDVLVSVVVFSVFMPIIGNTFSSLSDTIYGIIRCFVLFINYIIVKNECKKNQLNIEIIINTIIFSILLLCIIGIDEINLNLLENFKKLIGYKYIQYDEIRVGSLFSYPNTMATMCGLGIFLCLRNIFRNKKIKYKVMYLFAMLLMFTTMILTYSRLGIIIFTFVMIVFVFTLLKKYKIKEKLNKKVIIILLLIIALMSIYVIIGVNIPDKIKVQDEYQKIMYTVEGNKDYEFRFNITAKSSKEDFSIIINEKNKYFDDINKTEENFGNFQGEKIINIHTKEDTVVIYIYLKNTDKNSEFIINSAKINNEKFILKYKFLPTNIVDKISNISFNNKSAWERFAFVNDAFKIIKENWIFGTGYNSWQNMQYGVQEYNYYSKEVHNFLIQIFLENGIIAFVACIGVLIYILNKLYKETKEENIDISKISCLIGIIFILIHSLFDFNMSFFYVSLILSILIAIVSSKEENGKEIQINGTILYILFIIMCIFIIYVSVVKNNFNEESKMLKINSIRTEESIFYEYNKLLAFDNEIRNRYYIALTGNEEKNINKIENVFKKHLFYEEYDINNLNLTNLIKFVKTIKDEKNIKFIVDYIKETKVYFKYQPELQIQRFDNMLEIIEIMKAKNISVNEIKEQLESELEYKEKYIFDYQKCRYTKEKLEEYKKKIEYLKVLNKE